MFTGIVQELGTVTKIERTSHGYMIDVVSSVVAGGVKTGDSVALNGVCLTVTNVRTGGLSFDVMAETVRKTTLASLKPKDVVHLEGALRADGSLDGHFVLGHIDCVGTVRHASSAGSDRSIEISFPDEFAGLVVEKGSIAIDGVSLTVGAAAADRLTVYLIPHTLAGTALGSRKPGDAVNLEFDILGKYIARAAARTGRSRITEGFLKAKGF